MRTILGILDGNLFESLQTYRIIIIDFTIVRLFIEKTIDIVNVVTLYVVICILEVQRILVCPEQFVLLNSSNWISWPSFWVSLWKLSKMPLRRWFWPWLYGPFNRRFRLASFTVDVITFWIAYQGRHWLSLHQLTLLLLLPPAGIAHLDSIQRLMQLSLIHPLLNNLGR